MIRVEHGFALDGMTAPCQFLNNTAAKAGVYLILTGLPIMYRVSGLGLPHSQGPWATRVRWFMKHVFYHYVIENPEPIES